MIADVSKFEKGYLLSMISPENEDVIEIGCGYGEHLSYLSITAKSYRAIDVNPKAITQLKSKYSGQSKYDFRVCNSACLPFDDESADKVVSIMCFHELKGTEQSDTLKEMLRVLKPNGQIIIIDPAFPSGIFQQIFDIAHRVIFGFDHPEAVIKSQDYILSFRDSITVNKTQYSVKYQFNNIEDLLDYVFDSFADETSLSNNQKEEITIEIKQRLKANSIDYSTFFVLKDEVSVFCLVK